MMSTVVVSMLLLVSRVQTLSDAERGEAAPQTQASIPLPFGPDRPSHYLIVMPEPVFDWKPKTFLTSVREHPEPEIRSPRDDLEQLFNAEGFGNALSKRQLYTFYTIR